MFCANCRKIKDKGAIYCEVCGSKLQNPLQVVLGPLVIESKKRIVQVVELSDKTRQIHVFTDDGSCRAVTQEDNITWEDLELDSTIQIPIDELITALLGKMLSE